MIVFELQCQTAGHRFEGWFGSSQDYEGQQARGLVSCPHCGCGAVIKAPMAPAVPRKSNQLAPAPAQAPSPTDSNPGGRAVLGGALPPEAAQAIAALAELQARALAQSRWVGKDFSDASRAMHYGERETETIHGQASPKQARELLDEGIAVLPLVFPIAPPEELN